MDFDELKEQVDQIRTKVDKASGAVAQLMKQLKDEFGCKSVEEAEELLKSLKRKHKKSQQTFEQELESFLKEYKDVLED